MLNPKKKIKKVVETSKDKVKPDPLYKFKDNATKDSAAYYKKEMITLLDKKKSTTVPLDNYLRQFNKGKAGYDKNGFPLKKNKKGGVVKSKKK